MGVEGDHNKITWHEPVHGKIKQMFIKVTHADKILIVIKEFHSEKKSK